MIEILADGIASSWISENEAAGLLRPRGFRIGSWNQIDTTNPKRPLVWSKRRAPRDGLSMFAFATYVSGWLPRGEWKLVQFTNSTGFVVSGASFFRKLCPPGLPIQSFTSGGLKPIKVAMEGDSKTRTLAELAVIDLVFAILLLEEFAYVVSEGSAHRQMLGLFDGYACLYCDGGNKLDPDRYFARLETGECGSQDWLAPGLAEFDD